MNIGVLGGTFDPIHNGHLILADEVRTKLELDEVLFVPAGQPWLKGSEAVSSAEHRVEMVRLAIADKSCFRLSTIEIERAGPTYSVDTVAELRSRLGASDELFFIMGWDNLAELFRWRQPGRLITLCRLVAVPRPGYPLPDIKALEESIPGISQRVTLVDKPEIDVSASAIRGRVARGLPIGDLVPELVEGYIKQHKLYLKQGGVS